MGGMGEMMGQMMKQPAKQFYPSLMNMPTLTPEARQYIEREAQQRLATGAQSIGSGETELHHAMAQKDAVAIQNAAAGVREGLLQAESGAAALRALSEGQEPRQFALTWFKGQMSLPVKDWTSGDGLWGLSWYHLTMMAFLVAFLLGAILIHYARLRSIGKLVQRLTPPPAGSSAPVAPTWSAPLAQAPVVAAATSTPASAPKRPWSGLLRVAAIFEETPNVKTFRFVGTDAGVIPFTFIPGQFLTFSAEIDGKPIRRSYTIASSPTQHHYVEITVKREEQGAESRYLHDHVAIGDRIEVSGPSGVFTFTSAEADSIVLIGGGVGITPLMCIVRYLTDRAFPGDIFFLYAARTPPDFIFREELDYLVKRHRNLHVSATMARAEGTSWTGTVGYISKEFIAHAVPDIARRRVHVCGPPPMMEAVKAQLLELGVARGKIKSEAFGPALGAAPAPAPAATSAPSSLTGVPTPAPSLPAGGPTPATPAVAAEAAPAIPSAQVEVQFSKSGKTGPLAPDQSVLEAAEALGVAIDFSCRVGTCGTCVVPLLKGSVTMAVEEGLPPADKARGIILACQAKSAGALVVDA
jgi:ferredoxin-NADP reductase